MIRNATYTLIDGAEIQLSRNEDGSFRLISREGLRPDLGFELYSQGKGIYFKNVSSDAVQNAFLVQTFALYGDVVWQVDRIEDGKIRLTRTDNPNLPNVIMKDRDWFEISIPPSEAQRIWEERKISGYGLPFPEGIAREVDLFK
jgi:hypothetical protein